MTARTVTETLSVDEALGFVRDVLEQTDDAAVMLALTSRMVGPLTPDGARVTFHHGAVGRVTRWGVYGQDAARCWSWAVYKEAWPSTERPDRELNGMETSREAADAKLCEALAALGFRCLGAP